VRRESKTAEGLDAVGGARRWQCKAVVLFRMNRVEKPQDIIRRKRDGAELSRAEIAFFVNAWRAEKIAGLPEYGAADGDFS